MGRPSITQPPVPASFIVEAFEVRDGVLIYRERPQRHFPHRVDDHARFNAKHAGKPAGFAGPRGVPIVRFVYDGKTRRIALLKVGWIVSTGAYPRGVVLPRDGDPWNVARDNLQVVPHGLQKPWTTGGGQASSLERKAEVDASLLAAMAEHEGAGLMQLAKLVGIGEGRISTKLGRLASRGLAESPQCVPGRSWALTEAGREIVQGEKPLIDDLDRDILRALARTPMGPVRLRAPSRSVHDDDQAARQPLGRARAGHCRSARLFLRHLGRPRSDRRRGPPAGLAKTGGDIRGCRAGCPRADLHPRSDSGHAIPLWKACSRGGEEEL